MKNKQTHAQNNWQTVEFKEIADFLRGPFGSDVKKSNCIKKGPETFKLYEQGNVIQNDFKRGNYYISKERFEKLKKFEVMPGDILITCAGTLGKIAIVPENIERGIINSVLMRIRLDKSKILTKYFLYFFQSPKIQTRIFSKSIGATIKNLFATKNLKTFKIQLPPMEIQEKLVSIFEKMEQITSCRDEVNKLTNKLLESTFIEFFGDPLTNNKKYEVKKLGSIVEINPKKSEIEGLLDDTEVSFIEMASISNEGKITRRENRKLIQVKKGFTYFKNNDVLFAKITPCMENGKGAIANNLKNQIGFGSTEFHVLRPSDICTSEWLFMLTKLQIFRNIAKKNMTGTAGQKRVPKEFLLNFAVPLPPIQTQKKFSSVFNLVENIKENQWQSNQDITQLFNVLVQKAFNGELVN